jgi:hypothetical protein
MASDYYEPTIAECVEAYNLNGVHPAADLFPLITGQAFQDLCESIGKEGLELPVVLTHDGYLLDGRNRLRALYVTGMTERFQFLGDSYAADYPGYVMRLNLHRRHLSSEERKVLYFKLRELRGVREKGGNGSNQHAGANESNDSFAQTPPPPSRSAYAAEIGVGSATITRWESDAKILDKVPELKAEVLTGQMPVTEAVAVAEFTLTSDSRLTDDQERRLTLVREGHTQIANISKDKALIAIAMQEGLYVRVDRNTIWGNPFILDEDGDRDTVIKSYSSYLKMKPSLKNKSQDLRGKLLGCWCYPEDCHASALIKGLKL